MVSTADLTVLCNHAAIDAGIDPKLARAIVTVESSWNPLMVRAEPTFAYVTNADEYATLLRITPATERTLQKLSYGLTQIMGATARTLGFPGLLTKLFDPEINLHWGMEYLARIMRRYSDQLDVIAAYNAGTPRKTPAGTYANQGYVDAVIKEFQRI